jgi:hypothetical protein
VVADPPALPAGDRGSACPHAGTQSGFRGGLPAAGAGASGDLSRAA